MTTNPAGHHRRAVGRWSPGPTAPSVSSPRARTRPTPTAASTGSPVSPSWSATATWSWPPTTRGSARRASTRTSSARTRGQRAGQRSCHRPAAARRGQQHGRDLRPLTGRPRHVVGRAAGPDVRAGDARGRRRSDGPSNRPLGAAPARRRRAAGHRAHRAGAHVLVDPLPAGQALRDRPRHSRAVRRQPRAKVCRPPTKGWSTCPTCSR